MQYTLLITPSCLFTLWPWKTRMTLNRHTRPQKFRTNFYLGGEFINAKGGKLHRHLSSLMYLASVSGWSLHDQSDAQPCDLVTPTLLCISSCGESASFSYWIILWARARKQLQMSVNFLRIGHHSWRWINKVKALKTVKQLHQSNKILTKVK